jgi:hypothetical protein
LDSKATIFDDETFLMIATVHWKQYYDEPVINFHNWKDLDSEASLCDDRDDLWSPYACSVGVA